MADRIVRTATPSTTVIAGRIIRTTPAPGDVEDGVGRFDTRMARRIIGAAATTTTATIIPRRIIRTTPAPGNVEDGVGRFDTRMARRIIGVAATTTTATIISGRIIRTAPAPGEFNPRAVDRAPRDALDARKPALFNTRIRHRRRNETNKRSSKNKLRDDLGHFSDPLLSFAL